MKLNENNHKSLVSSILEKQKKKTIYQIKLNDEWEDVYVKDEWLGEILNKFSCVRIFWFLNIIFLKLTFVYNKTN